MVSQKETKVLGKIVKSSSKKKIKPNLKIERNIEIDNNI